MRSRTGDQVIYRTIELLSAIGIHKLWTKGTRVWKVIHIVDGEGHGDAVILKDSWVDEGRERETATLSHFRYIDHSEEFRQTVEKYFLTLECFGDVYIHSTPDPDRVDSTRTNCVFQYISETGAESKNAILRSKIHHKVHHRMVIKEVCEPLHMEVSLLRIFAVLDEISIGKSHTMFNQARTYDCVYPALKAMHKAGWIHCDISTGNILIDAEGHAKLVDMEYAQKMSDPQPDHHVVCDFIVLIG